MRILLTSPRAPVTLDLARRFFAGGNEVLVCDSLRFHVAAFSRSCRTLHISRPNDNRADYITRLQQLIKVHQVDWLIPTCEEAFLIAAHRERFDCHVLVDNIDKLRCIHNKWEFSQVASNEFGIVPNTYELSSPEHFDTYSTCSESYVFKPCFSRFASETLISPTARELKNINVTEEKRWIAQERVHGDEFSTYSVAHAGNLVAHACYSSPYRADRGSGIYFKPANRPDIRNYVKKFVAEHAYTGQIGFDCIVGKNQKLWILECNPRATSGLHLFPSKSQLAEALIDATHEFTEPRDTTPRMLVAAMPLWGLAGAVRQRKFLRYFRDMLTARDVLFQWRDPLPLLLLPLTMLELASIAIHRRISLQQAATRDIEWNGDPL